MGMPLIERVARQSDPGFLDRIWVEQNGNWMPPRPDELRAFLVALSREVEQ